MRIKIALAVGFSIILISIALWMRFENRIAKEGSLAAKGGVSGFEEFSGDFFPQSSSVLLEEGLSNTSLVSRQIFSDFINLSARDLASQETIDSLAEKYITDLPAIQKDFYEEIKISEIKTVRDSLVNVGKYEEVMNQTHQRYGAEIELIYSSNNPQREPLVFLEKLGDSFLRLSNSLKIIEVPDSIVRAHVKLLNSYLATSVSMEKIALHNTDPITSVAAIDLLKKVFDDQSKIMNEISDIVRRIKYNNG